jgi:hypothetical protein
MKQLRVELPLERGNRLGDGGLGDLERVSGTRERAVVDDRKEDLEAPNIHKCRLSKPSELLL